MRIPFHAILAVMAVAIFYTNIPDYLHVHFGILNPFQWVIVFGVLCFPIILRQVARSQILKSPIIIWCLGYAIVTIIWFIGSAQSDVSWQVVRWRFLNIIEIFLFLTLFSNPEANRSARLTVVGAVVVGCVIQLYELYYPMTFSEVMGRSAGLYMNPNTAGAALVAGMLCAVTVVPMRYRVVFILLTGLGVFASSSRGSILSWTTAVVGLMIVGHARFKDVAVTACAALLLAILLVLPRWDNFVADLEQSGSLNRNVQERLASLVDLSGPGDESSWSRRYLVTKAWEKIEERPFWGWGTGASFETEMAAHNQSLIFMHDHGILGILILPLLLAAVVFNAREQFRPIVLVFCCTIMVMSLFSHHLLNQVHTIIMLALATTTNDDAFGRTNHVIGDYRLTAVPANGISI